MQNLLHRDPRSGLRAIAGSYLYSILPRDVAFQLQLIPAQRAHADWPLALAYAPAAQGWHARAPLVALAKVPGAHGVALTQKQPLVTPGSGSVPPNVASEHRIDPLAGSAMATAMP